MCVKGRIALVVSGVAVCVCDWSGWLADADWRLMIDAPRAGGSVAMAHTSRILGVRYTQYSYTSHGRACADALMSAMHLPLAQHASRLAWLGVVPRCGVCRGVELRLLGCLTSVWVER
jgi:hypothetical protein